MIQGSGCRVSGPGSHLGPVGGTQEGVGLSVTGFSNDCDGLRVEGLEGLGFTPGPCRRR